MTVAQLKRHIDRRLRTKADKADLRGLERRMDSRFVAVEARFEAIDRHLASHDSDFARIDRRFDSVDEKLDAILREMRRHYDATLDNHERRLLDLETAPRDGGSSA